MNKKVDFPPSPLLRRAFSGNLVGRLMRAWPDIVVISMNVKQSGDDNDKVEFNFVEDVSDYGKEDVFFDSDCNDHGQEEGGNVEVTSH